MSGVSQANPFMRSKINNVEKYKKTKNCTQGHSYKKRKICYIFVFVRPSLGCCLYRQERNKTRK